MSSRGRQRGNPRVHQRGEPGSRQHASATRPNVAAMAAALERFLHACGLDTQSADLKDTPERVAAFYAQEMLDGYAADPKALLAAAIEEPAIPSSVFIGAIRFHAMCPHHLLPYRGLAYVGYVPIKKLLGFGRVASLVGAYAHRLTLQERITNQVTSALVELLPAAGAGCILVGEHQCLSLPGDRHDGARVVTSAFDGQFPDMLRQALWARLPAPLQRDFETRVSVDVNGAAQERPAKLSHQSPKKLPKVRPMPKGPKGPRGPKGND